MRRKLQLLVLPLLMTALLSSCCKDKSEKDEIERTVLVYMAADNNLSGYCEPNMTRMRSTLPQKDDNNRLVVFVDRPGQNPLLLRLRNRGIDTIRVYPQLYSTDPKVFSYVIKETISRFPAKHYGLVMWSHGTGWIPSEALHFTAPNLGYVPSRDGVSPNTDDYQEGRRLPFYETRSFGYESVPVTNVYGGKGYTSMDIQDMAEAIPNGQFDYILFDACYMANIEIAFALRRKAKQIVSSCYEIVADGFPYHLMTGDMMSGDMNKAAECFYQYYRNLDVSSSQMWQRMGGISVVETAGLDSLARCFKKIVKDRYDDIVNLPVNKIQCFDRFSRNVFYDLDDMVGNLCTDPELLTEFRNQMKKCISYSKSTPYMFPGDAKEVEIKTYCGVSVYIPRLEYGSNQIILTDTRTNLNAEYQKTAWSTVTGYGVK